MKICEKCKLEFPVRVKIEGVWKSLQNRRFCLECSPYGHHNTKNLLLKDANCVMCPKCGEKDVKLFFKKGSGLQSWCKKCTILFQKIRWNRIKAKAIAYLGGKCIDCQDGSLHHAVYDFHHKSGVEKKDVWNTLRLKKWSSIVKELDKCELLCCRCHRLRHINKELWMDF